MISIERLYRHRLMIEQLQEKSLELGKTAQSLYRREDDNELTSLHQADQAVRLAIRALREAEREARAACEPALIEAQFTASIELIHRSPERMRRCAEVGATPEEAS